MRVRHACLVAVALLAASACSTEVRESVVTVLTLEGGSMSALREKRGDGPFRTYPIPPAEMLALVEAVLKTQVVAVFAEPRRGEVVAKERSAKWTTDDTYGETWTSAVIVFVHPVRDDPASSKVEIHAGHKGVFKRGRIRWARELPALLDDAVAHRGTTPIRSLR